VDQEYFGQDFDLSHVDVLAILMITDDLNYECPNESIINVFNRNHYSFDWLVSITSCRSLNPNSNAYLEN